MHSVRVGDVRHPLLARRASRRPAADRSVRDGAPWHTPAALPGTAAAGTPDPRGAAPFELALIAGTPYGTAQRHQFPALVADIDADPQVRVVLHGGDVKNGSSTCDDARFADLAALYGTFDDPFVLTPGDNEWTDCHRTAAGGYLPTERLEAVRRTFFPEPGRTLGRRTAQVTTQASDPAHAAYVENVCFTRSRVVMATVHVVGSENDLDPWAQLPGGDRPQERLAEFEARQAAALSGIDATFDRAKAEEKAAGVLLPLQAEPLATPGFRAVRDRILSRSRAIGRPVLLVHGDEHRYEQETAYGGVPDLTRLETGATAVDWLRLTVDPRDPAVFS